MLFHTAYLKAICVFQYVLLNDAQRDQRIQVATEKRNKQLEKLTKIKNKKVALRELARKQEQQKQEKQVGFSILFNRISSLHHCAYSQLIVLSRFTLTSTKSILYSLTSKSL